MAKKGDWVRVHRVVLSQGQRAENLPSDTQKVPFEMWVKGWLLFDGEIGDTVKIRTRVGREESGTLIEVNPQFSVDYGDFVPEILTIDRDLKAALGQEDS